MNNLDDESLVKMVQEKNDMFAFETLAKRYQHMIYNVCFRFTGQKQDALDCAQDSFIKVYENIKSFKHLSSFKTWLYRITVNTCKNHISSREFKRRLKTVNFEDRKDLKNVYESPSDHFERQRLQEIVQCAIDKLPSDQKLIIVLRDIQQLSYEEIEQITKLPAGTVKSKISRARNKLKELLKDIKNGL